MRAVTLVFLVGFPCSVAAQTPPTVPVIPVENVVLPAGQDVSRPLTPVQVPVVDTPIVTPPPEANLLPTVAKEAKKSQLLPKLPQMWDSWDLLLYWTKGQPVPPLAVGYRAPFAPSTAAILTGGTNLQTGPDGGARFTLGRSFGESAFGYEASYLFLGGQTGRWSSAEIPTRYPAIARPFYSTTTGDVGLFGVNTPPNLQGGLDIATSTRLSTWEVNAVGALWSNERARLSIHAGWRYFRLKEGLAITQVGALPDNGGFAFGTADTFETSNRFSGAQIGMRGEIGSGPIFMEVHGSVAFGSNHQTLRTYGITNITSQGGNASSVAMGGLLAVSSNSGSFTQSQYAVLPEARVKVGFKVGDHTRFTVGYNLLYLNNVVRPGNQIDLALTPSQSPLLNSQALMGNPGFAERPGLPFGKSEFWAQGLALTWESRY